jgi:hypothetical protein
MWMSPKIRLSSPAVRDVGVQLGRAEIGVAEHLLHATEVGAALEEVRRERVPEQMRMDTLRIEARGSRQPPQDQERAGPGERPALRVQEELGAVAAVEERPAAREVAAQCLGRLAADRHDPLLAALADDAHEPVVEVDAALLEADGLRDPEPGTVEQLDEGPVAEGSGRDAARGVDQPLRHPGR